MPESRYTIAVTTAGVQAAVKELSGLVASTKVTGEAVKVLATSTSEAFRTIQSAATAAGGAARETKGFETALKALGDAGKIGAAGIASAQAQYKNFALIDPLATPIERLTAIGNGSLKAGLELANMARAYEEANRASLSGDGENYRIQQLEKEATLQRQNLELSQARGALVTATGNLATAQWERELVAMQPVERATAQLARAEQQLTAATEARVAATAGETQIVEKIRAETVAREQEVAAYRAVTIAQQQLTRAQEASVAAPVADVKTGATAGGGSAFQSSFSYFLISGIAGKISKDIIGIGAAGISASSEIERSFADVNRTFDGTKSQLNDLKSTLYALSTSTPNSFVDLAKIATLGNQLGVAAEDIASFTTTIAQYTAISGETADAAATAFGKIANLTGLASSQFSNLGSSIEYVARTTVSTEKSISATAQNIAAFASGAGFSAQAVVGLSAALASLSIQPQAARGAMSIYFNAINKAVADGGPKLQEFAILTGKTADEITRLVNANQGQEVFTSFIAGLSKLDSVAKTTALKDLGLSSIRTSQAMRALASNVPLLTSSFEGANTAFLANVELGHQYAIIQDTLASKWKEFQSAIQNGTASIGDAFNIPGLLDFLGFLTEAVKGLQEFSHTLPGKAAIIAATVILGVVAALTGLVSIAALAKATMTILPWALTGLEAEHANSSIVKFIAGMFGLNIATKETAAGTEVTANSIKSLGASANTTAVDLLNLEGVLQAVTIGEAESTAAGVATVGALEGVEVASGAATAGLRTFKIALATTGIGLGVVLLSAAIEAFVNTGNAAQTASEKAKAFFGSPTTSLTDGLTKDQQAYINTGKAIDFIDTKVKTNTKSTDAWVGDVQKATGAMVLLGDGTQTTTKHITDQTVAYGENAKAALAATLANNTKVQGLFKDTKANTLLESFGFNPSTFLEQTIGDPVNGGKKYVDGLMGAIAKGIGTNSGQLQKTLAAFNKGFDFQQIDTGRQSGSGLQDAAGNLTREQLKQIGLIAPVLNTIGDAASATSFKVQESATASAALAAAQKGLGLAAAGVGPAFEGAASGLVEYQKAVGSGISKFVDFGTVLKDVQGKLKTPLDVNATAFSKGLATANASAVTFYQGINQLAADGAGTFATSLAALGPDAGGILASSLKLSPDALKNLEANAQFAGFLASDQFKAALQAGMDNKNSAYATIFGKTGNLADVQAAIKANVDGTFGAYELAWDQKNPDLPLNVTLKNPTADDLALAADQISGRLTVSATVIPVYGPKIGPKQPGTKTYSDTLTGAKITLPADLDGKALSASLAHWKANEGSTPTEIKTYLNTQSFSSDLASWVASHGKLRIPAVVVPGRYVGSTFIPTGSGATGGEIKTPRFADGGQFRGPGTGTSDSILARVSMGEYISTNSATNFWGADFFDSLNKKMLPTSFLNMLGAAAVSGNQGPQHTTNVSVVQNYPQTVNPLKELRVDSENLIAGIWA